MKIPGRVAPFSACLIAIVIATTTACGGPPPVTPAPAAPSPAATPPRPTPSPSTEAQASIRPIGVADIGAGAWKLIATDTNEGASETAILGNVQNGFGWVITCSGAGRARLSLSASTSKSVADPASTPNIVVATTYQCPTTEVGEHFTGQYDGGAFSISPNIDADEHVVYRLLVATLP